jgi:hypothetical protein
LWLFFSLVLFTTFRNRRQTIHSILSLVARFSRPVQNITTTFACLVACPVTIAAILFLSSLLSLDARCSERVQSAQARVRVHVRPRLRDNKCFSSMFYACACVCCSSLKSISRPSLCCVVAFFFFPSLYLSRMHIRSRTILSKKKNRRGMRMRKRKETIWRRDLISLSIV